MGKKLIIKDADFSANAIETGSDYISFVANQHSLSIVTGDVGNMIDSTNNAKRLALTGASSRPILIPSGSSMTIKGLKGTSGTSEALRLDFVYYGNNDAIPVVPNGQGTPNVNAVGTWSNYVSANYFGLNTGDADSIVITNTYGRDYYFAFACKTASGGNTPASSYSTLRYKVS